MSSFYSQYKRRKNTLLIQSSLYIATKAFFTPQVPFPFLYVLDLHLEIQSFSFNQFIYYNWRLITLQYCGGFCHTLKWISHGFAFHAVPSLQSCLTLCDPMDYNPPGSSVHGIFPGKNTGMGWYFLPNLGIKSSSPAWHTG